MSIIGVRLTGIHWTKCSVLPTVYYNNYNLVAGSFNRRCIIHGRLILSGCVRLTSLVAFHHCSFEINASSHFFVANKSTAAAAAVVCDTSCGVRPRLQTRQSKRLVSNESRTWTAWQPTTKTHYSKCSVSSSIIKPVSHRTSWVELSHSIETRRGEREQLRTLQQPSSVESSRCQSCV